MFGFLKKALGSESPHSDSRRGPLHPDLIRCETVGKLTHEIVEGALREAGRDPATLSDGEYRAATIAIIAVADALSQRLGAPFELAAGFGQLRFGFRFCPKAKNLTQTELASFLGLDFVHCTNEFTRLTATMRGMASIRRIGSLALAFQKDSDKNGLTVIGEEILAMAVYEIQKHSATAVVGEVLSCAFDEKWASIAEDFLARGHSGIDRSKLLFELRLLCIFATEWAIFGLESEQPGGARLRGLFRAGVAQTATDPAFAALAAAYPARYAIYERCQMTPAREKSVSNLTLAFAEFVGVENNVRLWVFASSTFAYKTVGVMRWLRTMTILDE